MFDITPISQRVALLVPGWMILVLVVGVGGLLVPGDAFADHAKTAMFGWLPLGFALGSGALVADFFRRLRSGRLTTTQVISYRFSGFLMLFGSAFGWDWSHGLTPALCAVALVALLLPTRGRAQPSTWTYQG